MINVAVAGAMGRMGREVCKAVLGDPELELAGAIDTAAAGLKSPPVVENTQTVVKADMSSLSADDIDVLVDFTDAEAAVRNIEWALQNGINAVVGTTGIPTLELKRIARMAESGDSNVLIVSNFALGAALMMKFSEMAARVFDQCEIIELHHRGKRDAPSGTAIATAELVAGAIKEDEPLRPVESVVTGSRGGDIGPVRIHSVRLDGLVAHQEVLFGSQGQTLSIRHDTTDRTCFMPGVLLAVKVVKGLPPGMTVGLETLLDL